MNQMLLLEKQALKDEVRKLNERENDIMQKALEVEIEMNCVKSKKMEIVIGMYQDQLILEYKQKREEFEKQQQEKLQREMQNLQLEKDKKGKITDTLYRNIEEQIQTFQMILNDLRDKKDELETSFMAAQEYLRKAKIRSIEEYNETGKKELAGRIEKFKKQLIEQKLKYSNKLKLFKHKVRKETYIENIPRPPQHSVITTTKGGCHRDSYRLIPNKMAWMIRSTFNYLFHSAFNSLNSDSNVEKS